MNAEKWHHSEIRIAINDESQGSIAKNLRCGELLYYTFIIHSAGERIVMIGEHLAKLRAKSFSRLGLGPQNEHLSVIIRTSKNVVICDYHFTRV